MLTAQMLNLRGMSHVIFRQYLFYLWLPSPVPPSLPPLLPFFTFFCFVVRCVEVGEVPEIVHDCGDPDLVGITFSNTFFLRFVGRDVVLEAAKALSKVTGKCTHYHTYLSSTST